jgi:hypothetical protein
MATIKAGPKEQKLKEQREERQRQRPSVKIKAKGIGKVANMKLSQRPK